MRSEKSNLYALILGGSSGFGLAAAKELASRGTAIVVIHRDRQGAMSRIKEEFRAIELEGVPFYSFNADALNSEKRSSLINEIRDLIFPGKIKLLLHSIAFGALKLIAPLEQSIESDQRYQHDWQLNNHNHQIPLSIELTSNSGSEVSLSSTSSADYSDEFLLEEEELLRTVHAMGTSLFEWTSAVFRAGLFSRDGRVIGLTSEGNQIAWRGYAAVSAAKACLEAVSRSIAVEFGSYGIRSNIIQPGITDTPAMRLIPGNQQLMQRALMRNPLKRLTTTEDVAKVVAFLASDDAAWINGSLIRVDGGECISGL